MQASAALIVACAASASQFIILVDIVQRLNNPVTTRLTQIISAATALRRIVPVLGSPSLQVGNRHLHNRALSELPGRNRHIIIAEALQDRSPKS
jgi:hypothetical protein